MSCLRALLIQIGIKRSARIDENGNGLRALLIQIGIKLIYCEICIEICLRALLIQIGIKHMCWFVS